MGKASSSSDGEARKGDDHFAMARSRLRFGICAVTECTRRRIGVASAGRMGWQANILTTVLLTTAAACFIGCGSSGVADPAARVDGSAADISVDSVVLVLGLGIDSGSICGFQLGGSPCAECLYRSCCAEATACATDKSCGLCVDDAYAPPSCDSSATYNALATCFGTSCTPTCAVTGSPSDGGFSSDGAVVRP